MGLSAVVAGVWRLHQGGLDTPGLVRRIEQAPDLGVTGFDHADIWQASMGHELPWRASTRWTATSNQGSTG